jgi:hypothetical protein
MDCLQCLRSTKHFNCRTVKLSKQSRKLIMNTLEAIRNSYRKMHTIFIVGNAFFGSPALAFDETTTRVVTGFFIAFNTHRTH